MFEEYLVRIKLGISFFILSLVLVIFYIWKNTKRSNVKHVCVIVLGDLGRSPRMNYHCLSFANAGYNVSFIGYKGLNLF
jgi:beta-1,4-mannosyltransferase